MDITLQPNGAFHSALVHLAPGDLFKSDSGAMFRASSNVDNDVTTISRGGGLLAGLKRLAGGDTFFLSTFQTTDGRAGEVGVAPTLQGHLEQVDVQADQPWLCAGGSFLGCDGHMDLTPRFQGLKGFFSGENLFFMEVSGTGPLLVGAYGSISEVLVDGELIVDTGHVVAFESSLSYTLSKTGGSWLTSFLAGEGFVLHFAGQGRLLVQSHNPREFGALIGRRLPPRRQ
jgi:uncharacterized protein (TIGR00266 family)